jgi:hypothetical protein
VEDRREARATDSESLEFLLMRSLSVLAYAAQIYLLPNPLVPVAWVSNESVNLVSEIDVGPGARHLASRELEAQQRFRELTRVSGSLESLRSAVAAERRHAICADVREATRRYLTLRDWA